ncbi:MAG: FAD-dependent oxidoreductase [Akkermansiaceae bacterium]
MKFLIITAAAIALCITPSSLAAETKEFDVVVYSATPCGIAASIAAARQGARVIIIEQTKHVGGLSTSGLNTAEVEHMLKWTIGGFAHEFYARLGKHYGLERPTYEFESSVAEKIYLEMLKEADVKVSYGAEVETVVKEGTKITGIALTDGTKLSAKVFVDASYEGDLMARAGVKYVLGREAKSEFSEEAAGIRFDKISRTARTVDADGKLLPGITAWAKDFKEGDAHRGTMNYNFRLTITRDPEFYVPIPAPRQYDAKRYVLLANWLKDQTAQNKTMSIRDFLDFYGRRNGKFELNNKQAAIFSLGHFGGQFDWSEASFGERKRIFEDHMEYTLGLLHFFATDPSVPSNMQEEMKAVGLHKDEFVDNKHLPYQLYVRESRRMRGEYVVRQQDVQTDRRKQDSIGMGSHFMDCHHVQRLAVNENEFINEGRIWRKGHAYQIPYRSITPLASECTNLLVPAAASFTHVAYCTLRVEATWMITGHAAGIAAATAAKSGIPVQKIDVATLQKQLRDQKQVVDFIPGMPEKCEALNGPPEF